MPQVVGSDALFRVIRLSSTGDTVSLHLLPDKILEMIVLKGEKQQPQSRPSQFMERLINSRKNVCRRFEDSAHDGIWCQVL